MTTTDHKGQSLKGPDDPRSSWLCLHVLFVVILIVVNYFLITSVRVKTPEVEEVYWSNQYSKSKNSKSYFSFKIFNYKCSLCRMDCSVLLIK